MDKKKVAIMPGCIGCGLCQSLAPEVFSVNNVSHVKALEDYKQYEEKIKNAVRSCPVQVITYDE